MVLKIDKVSDERSISLYLSGRLRSEDIEQVQGQMKGRTQKFILNLAEVKLVDRDAVRFLGDCERSGVELDQCPRYVRDWIDREKGSTKDEREHCHAN